MGDRVTRVQMQAFRGVREKLTVELADGCSAVLFGENATGKSTVADALEWHFTGEIGFLRHEGRGGAIRHVGASAAVPTSVTVQTTGVLGGTRVMDGTLSAVVAEAGRETFLLRGRTLTSFVECTKGEKWRVLAELLGLQEVDQLRLDLQTVRNELRKIAEAAGKECHAASQALASKVEVVSDQGVLGALSRLCKEVEVAVPSSLEHVLETGWSASLAGPVVDSSAVQVAALAADLKAWAPVGADARFCERWNDVLGSQTSTDRARFRLFEAADTILTEASASTACPLCGQAVDEEVLRGQVRTTLEEFRASAAQFEEASDGLRLTAERLEHTEAQATTFRRRAAELGIDIQAPPASPANNLRAALRRHEAADPHTVHSFSAALNRWLLAARSAVDLAAARPATPREGILVEIGVLVDQARRWRERSQATERARNAAALSEKIFLAYATRQKAYFAEVLSRISDSVADIYAKLHPGEGLGDVCIEPWGQKGVELAVSFHGSRQKPPHGVLSESHLNSLAVALFLAMAETFNEQLDLLVLDDIVNSFDVEHRGELAAFLATNFSHRQLMVLTHDQLFFERLAKLAPSWKRIEFTSWDFDDGPRTTEYQSTQMLAKATAAIDGDDRVGAAMKGRRALEELLQEICEGFAAPLPFQRGVKNDRREIGQVLAGVRRVLRDLSKPTYSEIKPLLSLLEADVAAALNPEAHAGAAHPSVAEVRAALNRVAELDKRWTCPRPGCGTRVWHRGTPQVCQCKCGMSRFPSPPADTDAEVHGQGRQE